VTPSTVKGGRIESTASGKDENEKWSNQVATQDPKKRVKTLNFIILYY